MDNNKFVVLCKKGIKFHSVCFELNEAFEAIHSIFLIFGGIAMMSNHQGLAFLVVKVTLRDGVDFY